MSNLTDEQVNKIIAEYMGRCFEVIVDKHDNMVCVDYTESLDALVPVWEKIKKDRGFCRFTVCLDYKESEGLITVWDMPMGYETTGKTTQQAAAHATALAIRELNK